MKQILLLFLLNVTIVLSISQCLKAQEAGNFIIPVSIDTTNYNRYNELGLKTGLWLEEIAPIYIAIKCYKDGKENGTLMFFAGKGEGEKTLIEISMYNDGKMRGPAMLFNDNGTINTYVVSMMENDFQESAKYYPLKGYTYEYNDDGSIKAEGWYLYDSSWLIDDKRIGIWKIYNTDGTYYEKDYGEAK